MFHGSFALFLQPVASKITVTMQMYISLLLSYLNSFPFANLFYSALYLVALVFLREGSHCVVCTVPGAMGS